MDELEKMSLAELKAEREATLEELAAVDEVLGDLKSQLAEAKARRAETGDYSDRAWFRRTEDAKRVKGAERLALQEALGEINREIKKREHAEQQRDKNHWAWAFVRVVQREAPDKFEQYKRAADVEAALRAEPLRPDQPREGTK